MRNRQDGRSDRRGGHLLRWAERLLVIVGVAMLVWCALLVADARIAQSVARQALEAASHVDRSAYPPSDVTTGVPLEPLRLVTGSAVAALSIPRVHLSAMVLHGSDAQTLRRGLGHLEHTPLPGEPGNVVIAGHRDSFFSPLRDVKLGDDVFADTTQGRVHYRVTSMRVVNPHEVSVLDPTDEATLTLITCYPFWVLGPAPDRFVVRATRVVDRPAASSIPPAMSPPELIPPPVVPEPPARKPVALYTSSVPDDHARVRQAVERFRLTYNARLVSHHEVRRGGALEFEVCDVSITGDRADVMCLLASRLPEDGEAEAWTLTLDRVDGRWLIKSIVMD